MLSKFSNILINEVYDGKFQKVQLQIKSPSQRTKSYIIINIVSKSMGVLNGNTDLKVDYFEVWKSA